MDIRYYFYVFYDFLRFFQNPKRHDFLRFLPCFVRFLELWSETISLPEESETFNKNAILNIGFTLQ